MTKVVHCKKESYDVYIGRPSKWGNPFSHLDVSHAKYKVATREESIQKFEEWFLSQPELVEQARKELKGKTLACWCKPLSCHGDIIAKIIDK
jgi:hypothetical protein